MTRLKPTKKTRPDGWRQKEMQRKRTRLLSVRFTPEEFDQVCRLAGRAAISDYVRRRALDRQLKLTTGQEDD